MIKIIDTYEEIGGLFDEDGFRPDRWEAYINSVYENSAPMFKDGVEEYVASGNYTFEKNFLPILNAVKGNPNLDTLHRSFLAATEGLDRRVAERFGRELDTDIVLYLGLCNAAGWVASVNGRRTVLLGVEKILELGWHDRKSMDALIYHELGHVYHAQHGSLDLDGDEGEEDFLWRLFTEGVAMRFEQTLVGDPGWFHQGGPGWAEWCEHNFDRIRVDFDRDLPAMTRFSQRYFGDWVDYHGHGDVGYYLGARFVDWLLEGDTFDRLLKLGPEEVRARYRAFAGLPLAEKGRVALLPYAHGDDGDMAACWRDPGTQRGYNVILDGECGQFFRFDVSQFRFWVTILDRETGHRVGSVRLGLDEACPDMAVWIYPQYRGMGYGTEALRLSLEYVFVHEPYRELSAGCYEDNEKSMRMLRRVGFTRYPPADFEEPNCFTGAPTRQLGFRITAEQIR